MPTRPGAATSSVLHRAGCTLVRWGSSSPPRPRPPRALARSCRARGKSSERPAGRPSRAPRPRRARPACGSSRSPPWCAARARGTRRARPARVRSSVEVLLDALGARASSRARGSPARPARRCRAVGVPGAARLGAGDAAAGAVRGSRRLPGSGAGDAAAGVLEAGLPGRLLRALVPLLVGHELRPRPRPRASTSPPRARGGGAVGAAPLPCSAACCCGRARTWPRTPCEGRLQRVGLRPDLGRVLGRQRLTDRL